MSINETYGSNQIGYPKLSDEEDLVEPLPLDMTPLFDEELGLLPLVIAWLKRFAMSSRNLKLSSISVPSARCRLRLLTEETQAQYSRGND